MMRWSIAFLTVDPRSVVNEMSCRSVCFAFCFSTLVRKCAKVVAVQGRRYRAPKPEATGVAAQHQFSHARDKVIHERNELNFFSEGSVDDAGQFFG